MNCLKIHYALTTSDEMLSACTILAEIRRGGKVVPERWKNRISPDHPFLFMPHGQQEFVCEKRTESTPPFSKLSLFLNFSASSLKENLSYYSSSNKIIPIRL